MLLCIDVGNTHIVLGVQAGGQWRHIWRIHTDPRRTADEYAVIFRQLARANDVTMDAVVGAAFSTVVPYLAPVVKRAVEQTFSCEAFEVTAETPLGMDIRYHNPAEVGADRIVNAVAAKSRYGAPCIIVDLGTAVTLDIVSREGHYEGGVIMAGIEMSADALFQKTARLPRITLQRPPNVLGRSTNESIQAGLFWGIVFAIDGLIEALWRELGYETTVVATGGQGETLTAASRHATIYDPNITLDGLALIWEMNRRQRR